MNFEQRNAEMVEEMSRDTDLKKASLQWIGATAKYEYGYHFRWMGRPIIQLPQDMIAIQEIIWEVKPDLIIEAGIAHGGSLIMNASFLELLGGKRQVLGLDIDIREHNRVEIEEHSMFKRITMFEGSSISPEMATRVYGFAKDYSNIMVILDSDHTHDHVLQELQLYSPLVRKGSYCIVLDTIVEDLDDGLHSDRRWGKGNSPKTAVREFLKANDRFEVDKQIENKLLITVAPDGYDRELTYICNGCNTRYIGKK